MSIVRVSALRSRLTSADERLLQALVLRRRPSLDTLMRLVTRLGNVAVISPVTLTLALGAVPSLRHSGSVAIWTMAGSHLLVQLMKRGVCRSRPSMPVGFGFLIEPEDRFSFPSGHAAAGLSLALPMAIALGGALGALVLFIGLTVGVSRCYLGVHYPGDVFVGWSLATLAYVAAPWVGVVLP